MFEAYKVGVTLALQNQVSGVLGFIARDFIKTDREAKKLQTSLKEIKLLGMSGALLGGAGFMGLMAIKGAVKPATEYVHQLQLAKIAHIDTAAAAQAAWKTTSDVITTTAAANVAAIRELRMVFGDTGSAAEEAIRALPTVQRLQAVLQDVRGGNQKDEAYTVAKALEMKGDVQNPARFTTAADLMTKAMVASGGKVGATDFLSAFKYGRSATIGWDDRFTYSILPTLIQEMKSSGGSGGSGGPGNALMSAYAAVVGGTIAQKSLKVWQNIGLLDPSKIVWDKVGSAKGVAPGGIIGSATFQQDPYEWTQKYLVPALAKAGYDTEAKQRQVLQYLFSNRTAGFVMSQMALQGWKFDRDQKLIAQAAGLSAYDQLIKHDPDMAYKALGAQWENLKTAFGLTVVPVLVSFVRSLSTALNSLATFAEHHPTLTKGLMLTFGALSAMATIGGSLMIAGAGMKLIGVSLGLMTTPLQLLATVPLAGIATGLGLVTTALAALAPIVFHKEIAGWIDGKAPGIGDALMNTRDWLAGTKPSAGGNRGYAPPSSGGAIVLNHTTNLDGRPIYQSTTSYMVSGASGQATGPSDVDNRSLPYLAGGSGSW